MELPDELRYTSEHEWVRQDEDEVTVGITDYAQDALGDVVFVEVPVVGTRLTQGDTFGTIESVKAVSDLFAPVSGEVTARNEALTDGPEMVNESPYGDGWLIQMQIKDQSQVGQLLKAEAYRNEASG